MQATKYLIYDGDCGFCNTTVKLLGKVLNKEINLIAYQNLPTAFCGLTTKDFDEAIKFIDSAGTIYSGAHGIFKALSYKRISGILLWLYDYLPGFANVSKFIYNIVAKSRSKECKI